MNIVYLLLFVASSLSGCMPTMLGVGTVTTVKAARDGSISAAISDVTIATSIKTELMKANFKELYAKISIEVVNGRVLYTGYLAKEEDILRAIEIAWSKPGVTEVINEMHTDESSSHFDSIQYAKDVWITSQIKTKSIMHRDIKFVNYTVVTSKNIVYILGLGRSKEEIEEVARIASETGGVEKVVIYAKVK